MLVTFPFDDLTSAKVRPALCLTEPKGSRQHVVVAFIGSQLPDELLPSDIVLADSHVDFTQTGLRATSVIRLHRVLTISMGIVRRKLGVLSSALGVEVDQKLREMLCL